MPYVHRRRPISYTYDEPCRYPPPLLFYVLGGDKKKRLLVIGYSFLQHGLLASVLISIGLKKRMGQNRFTPSSSSLSYKPKPSAKTSNKGICVHVAEAIRQERSRFLKTPEFTAIGGDKNNNNNNVFFKFV